jgi:tetratricopeptide (TPR) repeat protein
MALTELGQSDEAIETLERATDLAPEDPDAWRQLGIAHMTAGERKAAVEAFRTSLRLHPGQVPVLVDLGNLLFMLARPQEAIDALEQARRLLAGDVPILRNLADMYISTSRLEEGLRTTLEILELLPEDILACCDAAWLYLQSDRLDEAAAMFRTLRRIDPDQEHELYAVHGLVMTEIRRRNWRRALELAIDATRLDRYDLTTSFLIYTSNKLFGKSKENVAAKELDVRFEAEHREHRRQHAEGPA